MKEFSSQAKQELQKILDDFPNRQSALLMVLRLAEKDFGCIDDGAMELVARECEVSVSHVLGMVTFYTHFKRPAHGRHRIMVCSTLMCSLAGSEAIIERISKRLNIEPGMITKDGLFSLEKVECLADCDKPTAIQVDAKHYHAISPENADNLIDELLKREGKTDADYREPGVKMDLRVPFIPVKQAIQAPRD